ncbi:ABC transporter substrate-binding protein [Rhizobium sp. BE258]|jgi:multiple sugar transport system substrate-binding protein|uniref:ABC transporter substrate-binding protein n=1 Tax=unclassified Rhizobium TaxID=2613769 RepID=UPI000DD7F1D1|nr:ABC transporter substrate-binding protein [Rhizobium sp. BE258]MDR7143906.1 multiple sugar transport system substrate-binding protein [Rhizobium sp. BE258]
MTFSINRRGFMAGGASLLALSGMGAPAFAQDARLRLIWWGSQPRADRTNKVSDLYKAKNSGVSITGEFLGWGDYWQKLATQVAGKNAPDVIQMDYRYIVEYARRGALAPLESYMPSKLQLGDFDPAQIEGGKVDGHLYGISLGANSAATVINTVALQEAGVEAPNNKTTWEELGKIGAEITKAGKRKGFFGFADGSGAEPLFENYVRQRGKALYTADSKIAFGVEDASEWFDMWAKFREAGACVPPDVQALYKDTIDTAPLTMGKAAIDYAHSNQFVGFQAVVKDKLTLSNYPRVTADSKGGHYRKPSMFFSVSAQSKVLDQAVDYVNFFVMNPDAAKVLDVERGIPESKSMRDVVAGTLDDVGKIPLNYVANLGDLAGPLPPPPPTGAGEGQTVLRQLAEQVAFGQVTPADAGKQLVDEITRVLARG